MYRKVIVPVLMLIYFTGKSQSTGIPAIGRNAHSNAEEHHQTANLCGGAASMQQSDFSVALATVKSQGFDETKLSTAKQIAGSNCLTTGQIAEICLAFGFEETKLNFAKFAYDHCVEPRNYFKLNNVFGFSSSVDELNKYVESKQ